MEKEEIRIKQRYKIEKVLGQGGFGVTYLAYDEELCQEVVLKKYRWEHGSLDNEVINKRDYYKKQRKAFLNEARILSSLFDIKEVVKVLDYFEERENAYIVMEFVQGISLRQYLESRNQPMSFTEAWNFLWISANSDFRFSLLPAVTSKARYNNGKIPVCRLFLQKQYLYQ